MSEPSGVTSHDGVPLPWLDAALAEALGTQQSHALLLHGPAGAGHFDFALALARGWLCDDPAPSSRPCGRCASCRLVQSHTHPDLMVMLPEALREPLGWGAGADEAPPAADKSAAKRKPSKEIRIDDVRLAVAFSQSTSARGRGKVVVLHPAERLNATAANALLKTLEEPPGGARLVLCSAAPEQLLPTLRSRCAGLRLALPSVEVAGHWLAAQAVAQPAVLLAAAGGQPQEALAWSRDGIGAELWLTLPRRLAHGDASPMAAWALPRVVVTLQKLCADLMRTAVGSEPVYFSAAALPRGAVLSRLAPWARSLVSAARHADHTWNAGLMLDALAAEAALAMAPPPPTDRRHG